MTLDIVAFGLAGLYLAAAFAMLTVGLIGSLGSPVSTRCRECARWITSVRGDVESTCPRCRRRSSTVNRYRPGGTW